MAIASASTSAIDRSARLLALAGELADDFATRADEHDRENTFPFENFERLKETNYIALPVREELGGLGGTLLDFAICQERLAQGCASTALAMNMHLFALGSMMEGISDMASGSAATLPANQPEAMAKMMAAMLVQGKLIIGGGFTEAEIGGNWGFPTTTAVRQEHNGVAGFVLNGRKTFTSLSPIIDLFSVNTSTTDAHGTPVIGLFVVPRGTPGIEIVETWDTMSMRATASHDMVIKDCWVPEQACVGLRAAAIRTSGRTSSSHGPAAVLPRCTSALRLRRATSRSSGRAPASPCCSSVRSATSPASSSTWPKWKSN